MDFLLQGRKKEERKGEFEEGSSKQPIQLALFNRDECYATGIDAAKGIGYRRCRYALFHGFIKPQADGAREYVIDNGKLASSISTLRISYTSLHASPHFVFLARVEETWTRNRIVADATARVENHINPFPRNYTKFESKFVPIPTGRFRHAEVSPRRRYGILFASRGIVAPD